MTTIGELSPRVPSAPATPRGPSPLPSSPADASEGPSPFARLVRGFAGEADRGEATVRKVLDASSGRGPGVPLDAPHLLALQAGIYRYGETMDLAARLVDKASSAVKTVIQGQ
jgi:hypothetical protein